MTEHVNQQQESQKRSQAGDGFLAATISGIFYVFFILFQIRGEDRSGYSKEEIANYCTKHCGSTCMCVVGMNAVAYDSDVQDQEAACADHCRTSRRAGTSLFEFHFQSHLNPLCIRALLISWPADSGRCVKELPHYAYGWRLCQ
jgi:hypothetical protein